MKTLLIARPDHSINLYKGLSKEIDVEIDYFTFSASKENSIFKKIKPSSKVIDREVNLLYTFTVLHQLLAKINKKISFDYYNVENAVAEIFIKPIISNFKDKVDIIHYWPAYCYQSIQKVKNKGCNSKFLADVYAAHPDYVIKILEPEYEKVGISLKKSHFMKSRDRDKKSLENVENILVASEYMKAIYSEYNPNSKIHVASYGLLGMQNDEIKSLTKSPVEKVKLVYVGSVCIEKGINYLLEAFLNLNNDYFSLDIIGEIPYEQEFIFKNFYNIKGVKFFGKLSYFKIQAMLLSYDVFVMPSLTDAYSLAVSEALSSNIPVIITENVGNKDDIIKHNLGIVCKIRDSDSLRVAIEKFRDIEYRHFLKENILLFKQTQKYDNYVNRVLEVYRKILE